MWKPIPSFPHYEISTEGEVRNKYGNILKPQNHTSGYKRITLGRGNQKLIHRLVGETYLERIEGKDEIDHINRQKTDNRVQNLRWCNRSENNCNRGKGYYYSERDDLYYVQKTVSGKRYRKGFKKKEDAQQYLTEIQTEVNL